MPFQDQPHLASGERKFGRVNWLGLRTLAEREIMRFLSVPLQTVLAPAVTSLLFVTIFSLVLESRRPAWGDVSYIDYIAPGMVMMAVIQNSFGNTSSSILQSKVLGNIFDTLVPPLSTTEIVLGYAIGGVVRGLTVAAATWTVLVPMSSATIAHPLWAVCFLLLASCLLACCGIVAGLWAEKFDHMSMITNFFLMPMSFLSGSFYSVSSLPEPWNTISLFNPLFYLIDGFRYGITGVSDGDVAFSLALALVANALAGAAAWTLFRSGYKIKD